MSVRQNSNTVDDVSRRKFLKNIVPGSNEVTSSQTRTKGKMLKKDPAVSRRTFLKISAGAAAVVGLAVAVPSSMQVDSKDKTPTLNFKKKVLPEDRKQAAKNAKDAGLQVAALTPVPGGVPDYFGVYPNYANSQFPIITTITPPVSVTLTGFTVTNGGSGYSTPSVILTGGGGTGATATARVANGVIMGVVLTNPGTGYTSAPTMTISDPRPRAGGAVVTINFTSTGGTPTNTVTGGIRKFVNRLPGLGAAASK